MTLSASSSPSASRSSLSFQSAAQAFIEFERERGHHFADCILLVPHHHAGQDFRHALRQITSASVVCPPRILTLPELAQTAPLQINTPADCSRLADLHHFLSRTGKLQATGLWQAAQELLDLLHELDMARTGLDTLPRPANKYLELEAGIAEAVWQNYCKASPGRVALYLQRLMWLAAEAKQPLYTLGLMGLGRGEEAFLAAWDARQPVRDLPVDCDLPERLSLLTTAWHDDSAALDARAKTYAGLAMAAESTPLNAHLGIDAAPSLEAAARTAEQTLLTWLAEGKQRIALIALDRLLARRLRALLERRDILVQDETGWAFSTSSVSHVLERWLGLVSGRIAHTDLLDLLKSPFVFAPRRDQAQQATHQLVQVLRKYSAPASLTGYLALARETACPAATPLLHTLETARSHFSIARMGLSQWTLRLLASLDDLQATEALATDPIGAQLLQLLQQLAQDTHALAQPFSFADWRRWLFLHLEQTTFIDTRVESPIRLTHLAAVHHRNLDAVLILGAGDTHLPGRQKRAVFNNATLAQLGLPNAQAHEALTQAMLIDVLTRVSAARFIWQSEAEGTPAPLSPWLVHLETFHKAAWGTSLLRLVADFAQPGLYSPPAIPTHTACSQAQATQMPAKISVSAWQSLVACPYQFFARHLLGLNAQDEMQEEMGKAEYGSLVHLVLARFHTVHGRLNSFAEHALQANLVALSSAVFQPVIAREYLASAWLQRWLRQIPAYTAWALQHEATGWHFREAEVNLQRSVAWSGSSESKIYRSGETVIYGRADRLDDKAGELGVFDYKTQSLATLKSKLGAEGEDVQLAAYAWLAAAEQAGFISVDEDKVAALTPAEEPSLAERAEAEANRIKTTLNALASGHNLPAHGAPDTCKWCEMQGLCRRAHQEAAMP